jgi:Uma2 family endonuclease
MATFSPGPFAPPLDWTVADLLAQVGGVPPNRVRMAPTPGTATEKDVLETEARTGRICELIDGVLVEKTMGALESAVAMALGYFLKDHLRGRRLGVVLGADGPLRILPEQVRIHDVSFLSFQRLKSRRLPRQPIWAMAPDLAVEVLSEGNTPAEMDRKLHDCFTAGVRLVWYIDPRTRTAQAYTAPDRCEAIAEDGVLAGGDVLPDFVLPLGALFAEAEGMGGGEGA